ncbi:hypothetical protein [Bradyrhizobium sp. 153]|uniref:hypothetical protein n=1 Tax=Bradyrhizobium sp. 153 TaxID=2782627 RepID=UPI001FFC17D3|nr:hypothetical protein [Bradyrhizobium sp. 153]MCK1668990.1 hypothetical protein [Bradyrhizobium sp. 153]
MSIIGSERRPTGTPIDKPWPDARIRFVRTAAPTAVDGLDLTVGEALALAPETFQRAFGVASLHDMPVVYPGVHLDRRPKGGAPCVRFRPAPKNPGPKDRKEDSFELLIQAPQRAEPEAGGEVAVSPGRVTLRAKTVDEARLEALVYLARAAGRRIRATTWSVERIQSLLCADVLDAYEEVFLADPSDEEKARRKHLTRANYRAGVRAFKKAFAELEIGDVGDWIADAYDVRGAQYSPMSRHGHLHAGRRGLKEGLKLLGVPPSYHLHFRIPSPGMLPKVAWTPAQLDAIQAAAALAEDREAWFRGIPFLAMTVSRHGRLTLTRWVPPEYDPMDGSYLPEHDRPWIEVLDDAVYYHRDGESRVDSTKRRGGNRIPVELEAQVREWYAADMAIGCEWVFHKPDGTRYRGRYLDQETFRRIVEDAGIGVRRVPHHLKDLAVQISDEAGMPREVLAAHADTSVQTLERKYGEPKRTALLDRAAEELTQAAWRERAARKAELADRFGHGRARLAGPTPARIAGRRTAG